jgi:magnesium transporter
VNPRQDVEPAKQAIVVIWRNRSGRHLDRDQRTSVFCGNKNLLSGCRLHSFPGQSGIFVPVQQLHGPETAGRLACRSFPTASPHERAALLRGRLTQEAHEVVDLVMVVDNGGHYQGVVELRRIMQSQDAQTIAELMRSDWPAVSPETDQEHAVEAANRAGVAALPVVSHDGKPLGVLSPQMLLQVLAREHREDIHRIVGILRERAGVEHALEDSPWSRAARRLPWLLVGLVMSVGAVGVMAGFERTLSTDVTIAFFIPALVYLADAIGTQTEAMVIRGLSLQKLALGRILLTEIATGTLIGLALATLTFLGMWLILGNVIVALGVAVSLLAAGTLASGIGLVLPWALSRARIDPAFGSGPVATIIQDVLTILVYFSVMTALLL